MAPHLAREDELPFVGQGTSLGTTTDSPPPTTTTTPNSAAEFDSNFAVGDADQDYYASTSNVAPNRTTNMRRIMVKNQMCLSIKFHY